jgi:hypothetical protein
MSAYGNTSVKMEKTRKQLRKESVKPKSSLPSAKHDICNFVACGAHEEGREGRQGRGRAGGAARTAGKREGSRSK